MGAFELLTTGYAEFNRFSENQDPRETSTMEFQLVIQ